MEISTSTRKKSPSTILVIDDQLNQNDPLLVKIKMFYKNAVLLSSHDAALAYLNGDHLEERNIVILDYKFDGQLYTGKAILETIRRKSYLIPVILWTASKDKVNDFPELINFGINSVVDQNDNKTLFLKIAEADSSLNRSIEAAIEEWIIYQDRDKRNAPYYITASGKKYSLNEILTEIRLRTPFGEKVEKDINMLAIDLLINNEREIS